ncbi:hypothetical protein [Spirosoma flavum]|uniref:Bacteriocin n=1 Tax=Spirosoma flavum TaxID=2048557 RepID=A0ABW6AJM9_9BACT
MLTDLTKTELKAIEGGNWLNALARAVDTILDIRDDFENNGSNRPFQKYE